jgi:hypothetical protein
MNVDYERLEEELLDGSLRQRLEQELITGFREIRATGERLPVASHYASRIAEIVDSGSPHPLRSELKFELFQEILEACEKARATVLGEESNPS